MILGNMVYKIDTDKIKNLESVYELENGQLIYSCFNPENNVRRYYVVEFKKTYRLEKDLFYKWKEKSVKALREPEEN